MINQLLNLIYRNRSAAKISQVLCSSFNTPSLKEMGALWERFSPKFSQFFKRAILTMGMDILTMTTVKHYS